MRSRTAICDKCGSEFHPMVESALYAAMRCGNNRRTTKMSTLPTPAREAEIRESLNQFAIRCEDGREVLTIAGPNGIAKLGKDIRECIALLDASRIETAIAVGGELRMRSALEAVMNDKPLACVYAEKLLRATDTPPARENLGAKEI